jgi:hypothetical protein
MSRLLFTLLPLLFGCGEKETAIPEYHQENGDLRMYAQTPTNGKTVLRFRIYKGDSIAVSVIEGLTKCVVLSSDSWTCTRSAGGSITVDGKKLIWRRPYAEAKKEEIFTRVRP